MSSAKQHEGAPDPQLSASSQQETGVVWKSANDGPSDNDALVPGSDEDVPPPAYGDIYGQVQDGDETSGTMANVTDDGRVNIQINEKTQGLSRLLVPALRSQLDMIASHPPKAPYIPPTLAGEPGGRPPPPLNVVIHVVGSRGDVQPFVALGKILKEVHHHRVRLATHPVFQSFVEENGLEFFSIGGDPAELMAFMVKNPGLMPGFKTLRSGDIGKRRREIGIMVRGCWRSCIEAGDGLGVEASDENVEEIEAGFGADPSRKPFIADAIIANPPSFAHVHCAEKLAIPLHMMFTMPWSPTQAFPHPLANVQSTNTDINLTNFITYGLVDMLTWQGLGDVINRFRQKSLGLEPVDFTWAPGMLARMRIPYTYCWSPALIAKPRDWGEHISISGFYFLNLASNYTPAPELAAFLENGPPPVYIGFGSIVVDDPDALTKMIFEAAAKTGQRALVSKGWGGVGADHIGIPEDVFMLGNVPHDWLFKHVSAVVHHGGAGTTAAGITAGKPTVIVPFFGDQPFWGAMVNRAGAGPKPVPYKELTADILAESINTALEPGTIGMAQKLADSIKSEKGTEAGAESFHKMLDINQMRCTLCPMRAAVWRLKRTQVKFSAFAAAVLGNEKLIDFADLKLCRVREHFTEAEPFDPISGGATALVGTMGSMAMGIADMPVAALKAMKIHPDSQKPASQQPETKSSPMSPASTSTSSLTSPSVETSSRSISSAGQPEAAHAIANQMVQDAEVLEPELTGAEEPIGAEESTSAAKSTDADEPTKSKFNAEESNSKIDTKPTAAITTPYTMDDAVGTGKNMLRIVSAGIKSPMDFTVGLARGFHNAPKLYGDEVRPSEKITDFNSGLRAAGKEFGFGFYDGISGLVTQPLQGAKKEGAAGFWKGLGKGFGGIVLKPGAAIFSLPGYTAQGIYRELQKRFGPNVENYIIASRTAQGYEEVRSASEDERAAVVRKWKEIKPLIRKKKDFVDEQKDHFNEASSRARSWSKDKKKSPFSPARRFSGLNRSGAGSTVDSGIWTPVESLTSPAMQSSEPESSIQQSSVQGSASQTEHQESEDPDFKEAVHRSVVETSRGDADEDALIEQAIRASVAELNAANVRGTDDSQLKEAMEQSIREATLGLRGERADMGSGFPSGEEQDHGNEELKQAFRESEAAQKDKEDKDEQARREEEIVMRYVMKQSLAEEEMRQEKQASS